MHNWSATAFYHNDFNQLIGHDAEQVNAWLAEHPDYDGSIYMNYGDGGDDVEVTDIFITAGDDENIVRAPAYHNTDGRKAA